MEERRTTFQRRRDLTVEHLNAIEGISCAPPQGAFYAFAECSGLVGKQTPAGHIIRTDTDLCQFVLETCYVAMVPGSAFGLSPYVRLSYATSEADLFKALRRLSAAAETLSESGAR